MEHQGEVHKYCPGLDMQKKIQCVEHLKKTMPKNFSHTWVQKAYWLEQANQLRVKVHQLKTAWKKHKDEDADIAKKGFRDPYWKSRYGVRGSQRKNRAGAGRRRTLKQAEEELATQVKAEEEAHGHRS